MTRKKSALSKPSRLPIDLPSARGLLLRAKSQMDRKTMNKLLAPALATSLALSASTAYAGGPVIIVDEPEVVAQKPASSVGILPLILVGIVLCIALCGGSDDEDDTVR